MKTKKSFLTVNYIHRVKNGECVGRNLVLQPSTPSTCSSEIPPSIHILHRLLNSYHRNLEKLYYKVSSSHALRQHQRSFSPYLVGSQISIFPPHQPLTPQVSIHYLDGVQTAHSIRGSEHCSCTQTLQSSHARKDQTQLNLVQT